MKILVVDDEEDVKTLFQQRFRREIRAGEFEMHTVGIFERFEVSAPSEPFAGENRCVGFDHGIAAGSKELRYWASTPRRESGVAADVRATVNMHNQRQILAG